jgi:hypothetical protein
VTARVVGAGRARRHRPRRRVAARAQRRDGHAVSGCCDEYGCRRTQPIALYLGDLSGQVFAATRFRARPDGRPGAWTATQKHDVTAQMREFIRRNPEWVRAQMENGGQ